MRHVLIGLLFILFHPFGLHPVQAETPERVVALNWALAEVVLELDVVPVGIADVDGYRTWVRQPALPSDVVDLGLRNEPNLERLAALAPDLILASDQQADLVPRLERIAPVILFRSFDAAKDNAAVSRETVRELARILGREDLANERLTRLDAQIAAAGARVREHFNGQVPPILPIRFLTTETLRLHGANSMAKAAIDAMGLEHAAPGEPTGWGFVQQRVEDLAGFEEAIVLHIAPFPELEELQATRMWQFMPFVRESRHAEVRPVWTFGGAFSIGHLSEAFADALLTIDPAVVE